MRRWWRIRRRLRRIADLEHETGLSENDMWWSLVRTEWYSFIDGGVDYHMPTAEKALRRALRS